MIQNSIIIIILLLIRFIVRVHHITPLPRYADDDVFGPMYMSCVLHGSLRLWRRRVSANWVEVGGSQSPVLIDTVSLLLLTFMVKNLLSLLITEYGPS